MVAILNTLIQEISGKIKDRIITSEDADYDETRQIWNAMIGRRPARQPCTISYHTLKTTTANPMGALRYG